VQRIERVGRRVAAVIPLVAAAVAASVTTAPSAHETPVRAFATAPIGAPAPAVNLPRGGGAAAASAVGRNQDTVRIAVAAAAAALDEDALPAVGQLLVDDALCTAAVVASSSGRMAVTAAHCVYVPAATERMPDVADGREPGWADEVMFVPARSGDDAPHEVWEAERMWVDRAWRSNASPEVDVAFLELRDTSAGTAQEVLGALGMRFDDSAGEQQPTGEGMAWPTVDVLGYPSAAPFDGTRLRSCDQVSTDQGWPGLLEARCGLTRGASGGPWVVPDRGWWSVVAVTSYLSWDRPGMLGGVRLGAVAERLWRAADEAAGRR
jgi:V8-like Glu-specific endopeptidase